METVLTRLSGPLKCALLINMTGDKTMGKIINMYKDNFLLRYDKDGAIPYYSAEDFPGLVCTRGAFQNSANETINFFYYNYPDYDQSKLILFCHGIGPGHTAYLAEIETLCKAGCRVLTYDCSGCGESGGERMVSINSSSRDAIELLENEAPAEEVIPVGHSLGGYTVTNIARLVPSVKRGVVISGFLAITDAMMGMLKFRPLANVVQRYEDKFDPRFNGRKNIDHFKNTTDRFLWIQSTDDQMVSYKYNTGRVIKMNKPNVRVITAENKNHNPQYTKEALDQMSQWMGGYYRLVAEGKLATPEERCGYFDDKPIGMMTAQDPEIYKEIFAFIAD